MEAIKLKITVESDTLKIPELKKFIGKKIEVILLDDSKDEKPQSSKYSKLKKLKGTIDFDDTALADLRKNSIL